MTEDEIPNDALPALRAEIDQMVMLMPELARTAMGWYSAFLGEGFSESQALYLTAAQLAGDPGEAP